MNFVEIFSIFCEKHIFLLTDFKGHFYIILNVRCFSSIFTFFEHSTLLAIPMHLMFFIEFQCFFITAVRAISRYKFQKRTKNKNMFFMFSRIKIHGRLTKNHECFRFSRHLPPVSKQYQNSYLYLMPLPSARENHQEAQNFHFFENFVFFLITLDNISGNRVFFIIRFSKNLVL